MTDNGSIANGRGTTLTGFLRVMELGPAPYYRPRMRLWLRAVLETDYRDSSRLENIQTLKDTPSFPDAQEISREAVCEFLMELAPPTTERLNAP